MKSLQQMAPWDWPEGSDRAILRVLQDKTAEVDERLLAAELAGDFVVLNDDLGNELISIVLDGNESEQMRSRAAVSFGVGLAYAEENGFDDDEDILVTEEVYNRMRQVLREIYMDENHSKLMRRSALEASVRSPEDWHKDVVRAAYASEDPDWKLTGVFCTQFIPGFNDEIVESLKSENRDIQFHALSAAGTWSVTAAAPYVLALLEDAPEDKELLLAAIEAAPFVCPEEATPLLEGYANDEDEEIAETANESMTYAQIGDELGLDGDEDLDEDEFDDDDDEEDEFDFEDDDDEEDEEEI